MTSLVKVTFLVSIVVGTLSVSISIVESTSMMDLVMVVEDGTVDGDSVSSFGSTVVTSEALVLSVIGTTVVLVLSLSSIEKSSLSPLVPSVESSGLSVVSSSSSSEPLPDSSISSSLSGVSVSVVVIEILVVVPIVLSTVLEDAVTIKSLPVIISINVDVVKEEDSSLGAEE